jgi:hypothetical protein
MVDTFELTFRGEAGPALAEAFHDLELTSGNGRTTLRGTVRDQAALQGILERVFDLGLEVLDLRVRPGAGDPAPGSSR